MLGCITHNQLLTTGTLVCSHSCENLFATPNHTTDSKPSPVEIAIIVTHVLALMYGLVTLLQQMTTSHLTDVSL